MFQIINPTKYVHSEAGEGGGGGGGGGGEMGDPAKSVKNGLLSKHK